MTEILGVAAAEQAHIPDDLAALEARIDEPENRDAVLGIAARHSAELLEDCLDPLPTLPEQLDELGVQIYGGGTSDGSAPNLKAPLLLELTPTGEKMLYDAALPTIVIDATGAFSGSELVAVAAQRRRIAGKPSCNVVLMPSSTDCGRIVEHQGESNLEVEHGILIGQTGVLVRRGKLSRPVRADLVETTNKGFLRQCQEAGIPTLNDPDLAELHNTKCLDPLADVPGVYAPRRLAPADMWREDAAGGYVIKPSSGSLGRGVRMFEGETNRDEAIAYYEFLAVHGYEPVVERRVVSWPLYRSAASGEAGDPANSKTEQGSRSGERLDWNVRALIACGKLIGMYVRADEWGGPINKSAGAEAIALHDLGQYVESPAIAAMLTEKLTTAGKALAEHITTGIAGADLVIDENGNAFVYEINVGSTGGLQTMAKFENGIEQKLAAADRLLEAWMDAYNLKPESQPSKKSVRTILRWLFDGSGYSYDKSIPKRHKIRRDVGHLHVGAERLKDGLGELSEATIRQLNPTAMEWGYWYYSQYDTATENQKKDIDHAFAAAVPLEFITHLGNLMYEDSDLVRLLPYLDHFEPIVPDPVTWDTLRGLIYLQYWSPKQVRVALEHSVAQGAPAGLMYQTFAEAAAEMHADFCNYRITERDAPRSEHSKDNGQDNSEPVSAIYAAYFNGDMPDAIMLLESELAEAGKGSRYAALLNTIGLEFALAEHDLTTCAKYIRRLNDSNGETIAEEILDKCTHLAADANDAETFALCIACCAQMDSVSSALTLCVRFGSLLSPAGRDRVAAALAEYYGNLYDDAPNTAAFAACVRQFIDSESITALPGPGTLQLIARLFDEPLDTAEVVRLQQELLDHRRLSRSDRRLLADALSEGLRVFFE